LRSKKKFVLQRKSSFHTKYSSETHIFFSKPEGMQPALRDLLHFKTPKANAKFIFCALKRPSSLSNKTGANIVLKQYYF